MTLKALLCRVIGHKVRTVLEFKGYTGKMCVRCHETFEDDCCRLMKTLGVIKAGPNPRCISCGKPINVPETIKVYNATDVPMKVSMSFKHLEDFDIAIPYDK